MEAFLPSLGLWRPWRQLLKTVAKAPWCGTLRYATIGSSHPRTDAPCRQMHFLPTDQERLYKHTVVSVDASGGL